MFKAEEIPTRRAGLTYDDVLLVPQRSEIRSRRDPSLQAKFTRKLTLNTPFVSANMDTITESEMAIAMHRFGGAGIIHRFLSLERQLEEIRKVRAQNISLIAASVGVNPEDRERTKALVKEGVSVITVDIAHGHSNHMIEMIEWIKKEFPEVEVIAGNVATEMAVRDLAAAGADAVKVGIGPGSMCTTRIITGIGVPQLAAIAMCAPEARRLKVPLIADGGLRSSGDIVKAIAAGADTVMLGQLLSGTIETPGEIHHGRKLYRGMASKSAQVSWRGELPVGLAPEGESTSVAVKGHVQGVLQELAGGVRSGMSYLGASDLTEVRQRSLFIEITNAGRHESVAHGLGR